MAEQPKFKYFPCTGAALDLLRSYKAEIDMMRKADQALHEEFEKRFTAVREMHHARLRQLWFRLVASVGLDPDVTWQNPEYLIEVRYLDEGFGAVLYEPRQPNPVEQAMADQEIEKAKALGIVGEDEPEDTPDDAVPDKGKMH